MTRPTWTVTRQVGDYADAPGVGCRITSRPDMFRFHAGIYARRSTAAATADRLHDSYGYGSDDVTRVWESVELEYRPADGRAIVVETRRTFYRHADAPDCRQYVETVITRHD